MRFVVRADRIIAGGLSGECRYLLVEGGNVGGVFTELPDGLKSSEVVAYDGCVVTPGLIDSHNHMLTTGLQLTYGFNMDFGGRVSFEEFLDRLREFASKTSFPWVVGRGVSADLFEDSRLPDRWVLDQAGAGKPVFLVHRSGHSAICDSLALKAAGVGRHTPNPPGGIVERGEDGEPNGILHERSAMELVRSKIPPYTRENYAEALLRAQQEYLSAGLTCVKDTGGDGAPIDEELRVEVLNTLDADGSLKLRVAVAIPVFSRQELARKLELASKIRESGHLLFAGFKLFLDGSGLTRTAWMKEDWNIDWDRVDAGNRGVVRWESLEEFDQVFLTLCAEPTNVSVHAVGDAAIEHVVALAEKAKNMGLPVTVAVVHCYVPEQGHVEKMAQLGMSVESQPSFIYFLGDQIAKNLGPKRSARLFPYRTLLRFGVNLCLSSDSPVTGHNPIFGMYAAMSRRTRAGIGGGGGPSAALNDHEALGFEEVVRCFSANPARLLRASKLGGLAAGMKADFVVWPAAILGLGEQTSHGSLEKIRPRAVYVDGKRVA